MNHSPSPLRIHTSPPGGRRLHCPNFLFWRCFLTCGALLLGLLVGSPSSLRAGLADGLQEVSQDQLKAVYLYNFLQFVSWPNDKTPSDSPSPRVIGLLGDPNVSSSLDELQANLRKNKKDPILIKNYGIYKEGMDLMACDILFVSTSERHNFTRIIASLKHAPVLTVGDTDRFLSAGGMIALEEERNRLRFRINRKATTAAGLHLSSQLLKTAIEVVAE